MEEIQTTATSAYTADVTPIVLKATPRSRLLFKPQWVRNPAKPEECLDGEFIYQKKGVNDVWEDEETISRAAIKRTEQYKLPLKAAELRNLVMTVGRMYRAFEKQQGMTTGRKHFRLIESGLEVFLRQSEQDLTAFLDSHEKDAVNVLSLLVRWLSKSATISGVQQLALMDPAALPAVSALAGISAIKGALARWEANRDNADEGFWQDSLERNAFVLSQLFAEPVVVIQNKAYLGGKAFDNTGGSYADFLGAAAATGALAIIEIKTPTTLLLGNQYRGGAFPASPDLSGAVAQVLKYRRTLTNEFPTLKSRSTKAVTLGGPRCLVVIGDTAQLNSDDMRESFETFRAELANVEVVTYDELFEKAQRSIRILEGPA